jgi:hypothetical protein
MVVALAQRLFQHGTGSIQSPKTLRSSKKVEQGGKNLVNKKPAAVKHERV